MDLLYCLLLGWPTMAKQLSASTQNLSCNNGKLLVETENK